MKLQDTWIFKRIGTILLLFIVIWISIGSAALVYGVSDLPVDNVGKGGDAQSQFERNEGTYSTWEKPNTTFKVTEDYSFRLNNTAKTVFTKLGTEDRSNGEAQHPNQNLSTYYIFNTKDNAKGSFGYKATNFTIYNPNIKDYDYVDIKVTFTDWEKHEKDNTGKDSFICVTHANARPRVVIMNLKRAKMKIEYFKAGTSQSYRLKSNATFEDIDSLQFLSFDHSANNVQKHYADENSELNYGYTGGESTYYCPFQGNQPNGNPEFAMGLTFDTSAFSVTFGNNNWNNYNYAYFGMFGYDMVKKDTPLPTKTVSDNDETDKTENTIENPDDSFTYEVKQEIPTGMSPVLYYKSFEIQDEIDSCLQIMDVKIFRNTTDVSNDFSITKDNNVVKAAAKASALADSQFYGGEEASGGSYRLQIKVRINKSVSMDQLEKEGHYNQNKTNLTFKNTGQVIIDGNSKNSNTVTTVLELPTTDKGGPGLNITKEVKRFEWQVTDKAEYTVKVSHNNQKALPDLTIKDSDLAPGLKVDKNTIKVTGTDDFTISEITGGFQIAVKRHKAGQVITVLFHALIDKSINGKVVDNTAVASSWGVPDKEDTATIYVNSPKNHIVKKTAKETYKPGDTIAYQLDVTQTNQGCFMRDIIIRDQMKTKGVILRKGSIQVIDTKGTVITNQCEININENQFEIKTGKMLVKGSNPYKFDAEEKITVTYEAEIVDTALAGKKIDNVAIAPTRSNTNGDLIYNNKDIPSGEGATEYTVGTGKAVLDIEKKSDKDRYQIGDNGQYELVIKQIREDAGADKVIIKDQFDQQGVVLKPELINVIYDGKDISNECKITVTSTGFQIGTNVTLKYGQTLIVKYIVCMEGQNLEGASLKNQSIAKADNAEEVTDDCTVVIIGPRIQIKKSVAEKINEVGGSGKYTLEIIQTEKWTIAKNVKITDQFQLPGVQYNVNSIQVYLDEREITDQCKIDAVDNGELTILTNTDLEYGQEMKVVYEAKYADLSLTGQDIKNIASAVGDKTNISKDEAQVTMKGPKVILKKTADKELAIPGDLIKYTVTAEQIRSDVKAKALVLTDQFQVQWIEIIPDSFQVNFEGANITEHCNITIDEDTFVIKTGVDLAEHEQLTVTYQGKIREEIKDVESIKNIIVLSGDNIPDIEADYTVWIEDDLAYLEVEKKSDKEIYREDEQVTYTIKTKAMGKKTAENTTLIDRPQEGQITVDMKSIQIFDPIGKEITEQCKITEDQGQFKIETGINLKQGETLTIRYHAKITEGTAEGNYIYNTAEVKADNTPKKFEKASITTKIAVPDKEGQVEGRAVQTGDTANRTIIICACLLAMSIIILLGIIRKKGNKKR